MIPIDSLQFNFERYLLHANFSNKHDVKHLHSHLPFLSCRTILTRFPNIPHFFTHLYPHLRLDPQDIDKLHASFWTHPLNRKFFLENLSLKLPLKISQHSDWLSLDTHHLRNLKGSGILNSCSVKTELKEVFPMFFWERLCGSGGEERRVVVDRVVSEGFDFVGVQEDLWEVDMALLARTARGSPAPGPPPRAVGIRPSLRRLNEGGIKGILARAYPELAVSFKREQKGYWHNSNLHLLVRARRAYDVRGKEEWYRLSGAQLARVQGKGVHKVNLVRLLREVYPEEEWEVRRFSEVINKRAAQKFLGKKLREELKGVEVLEEFAFRDGDFVVIFDFYVPQMGMVVEYQGELHYYGVLKWQGVEERKMRDEWKREICAANGLRLLVIPYWWDCSVSSLKQYLKEFLDCSDKQ